MDKLNCTTRGYKRAACGAVQLVRAAHWDQTPKTGLGTAIDWMWRLTDAEEAGGEAAERVLNGASGHGRRLALLACNAPRTHRASGTAAPNWANRSGAQRTAPRFCRRPRVMRRLLQHAGIVGGSMPRTETQALCPTWNSALNT